MVVFRGGGEGGGLSELQFEGCLGCAVCTSLLSYEQYKILASQSRGVRKLGSL